MSSCSAPGVGDAVAMAAGPLYCRDFKNLNDLKEVADTQIEKRSLVTDFEVFVPGDGADTATTPTQTEACGEKHRTHGAFFLE